MTEEKNSSNCDHNCDSCSASCSDRESFKLDLNDRSSIHKMIGIVSGKGGVGKSFVTSMMAVEMQRRKYRTAVMDGDITGPSQAKSFGISEKAASDGQLIYPAVTKSGIQVISTNMLLDTDDQPVLWRGPMVANLLKQFYTDVFWDDVDYMFVDMPPGTGDIPLTAFQSLPLDGIIIVTSPQDLVSMVVEKAINMAKLMNIRILGIVENMAWVTCPNCGEKILAFGHSHTKETAAKFDLEFLGQIPLDVRIAEAADAGTIEDLKLTEISAVTDKVLSLL